MKDVPKNELSPQASAEPEIGHLHETGAPMKKQFGAIATLGVAFTIMNSWIAEAASIRGFLSLGGTVTVIWGCVAAAIFSILLSAGVAELASAYPGAGGPYHYTFMVAAPKNRKLLSFLSGWSMILGWWFVISSAALFLATWIAGIAVFWNPTYEPSAWQLWLMYIAVNVISTAIAIGCNSILNVLTSISLYWMIAGFVICIVTSPSMHSGQPLDNGSFVFATFTNDSGWSNAGIAFVIGWMLSTYSFLGVDAATHLSEEMHRPEVDVPRAALGAIMIGLTTSFLFLVSLLFCITDLEEVVHTPTGVPILVIFHQATNSKAAATALTILLVIAIFFAQITAIAVAGRTTWAFGRDNGLPFSAYFSLVDGSTKLPLRATLLSVGISILYGAIYIGSATAFQSFVGSCIIMFFVIYTLPQGIIAVRGRHHLPPHAFDLGRFGWFLNMISPFLALFSIVILCLPVGLPVTPSNMNYLSVIAVGCWTVIIAFYFLVKKGKYNGPILDTMSTAVA